MHHSTVIRFLFVSAVVVTFMQAQQTEPLSVIQAIDSAFTEFDYSKADNLITVALEHIETYNFSEKLQIYTFAAVRKFQQGDQLQAKEYFLRILEISPAYDLDPVSVSPKIISLFQTVKLEYLEKINSRIAQLENNITYNPVPWRSLVFPGWEQWHRGYRLKGSLWTAAGTICMVGIVQSVIRTQSKKSDYQNAGTPEDVISTYNEYNRIHKSQFYWSYAYLTIWFASHLDALFCTPVMKSISITHSVTPASFTMILHYRF